MIMLNGNLSHAIIAHEFQDVLRMEYKDGGAVAGLSFNAMG
jgi:hypothetical protein